jgi:putative Ca2+/H+ antiporter (TMEM165/GDT1 family)
MDRKRFATIFVAELGDETLLCAADAWVLVAGD